MEDATIIASPNVPIENNEGSHTPEQLKNRDVQAKQSREEPQSLALSETLSNQESDTEEDTKILLEKEFDDYYEDRIHKSAGPVVFVSKCLGMLPLIWTDDDEESDCKSYFNMYTFLIFIGWIGLAVLTAFRIDTFAPVWPAATDPTTGTNVTLPARFFGRMTVDTYAGSMMSNCLVTVIFGVFKSRMLAEVLFSVAEVDSQLELEEKHYNSIKYKTLLWLFVELLLIAGHIVGLYYMLLDIIGVDFILLGCFILAALANGVLDLQYVHMCMVLCKRYSTLDTIIQNIIKPFRTFRSDEEPTNEMLQRILHYRWENAKKEEARNTFDHIWKPSDKDIPDSPTGKPNFQKEVNPSLWMRGVGTEISREEESTVVLQLDILRGIHSDLNKVGLEMNRLLGFQMLVNLITNIIIIIMFGFFFVATAYDGNFYWPFAVLMISPIFRILMVGHWAQVLKDMAMKPFWTMSKMSTLDGSPKLERQVQKFELQASKEIVGVSAAGYFHIQRSTITGIFGLVALVVFVLFKFDRLERRMLR